MKAKVIIREIRIQKGMTQLKLSRKSKVSQSHISDLENNTKSPTLDKLCQLAEALGVQPRDLVIYYED